MPFSEGDWKYLRKISDELLSTLCARINHRSAEILSSTEEGEHARYLKLYRHIEESDRIIGFCFNDWRRSTLFQRAVSLRRQGLLTDAHVSRLSPGGQEAVRNANELLKG
jgi:hypothetical protein